MTYDYIGAVITVSCVATKVATRALPDAENVLTGLRKFRDHGLKTWPTGRELANIYYRNSPEIALLLLRNPSSVADAVAVMKYFAAAGETLTNHQRFTQVAASDPVLVPADIAAAANRLITLLNQKGSAGLKQDLAKVRNELEGAQRMTLSQLQERAEKEKQALLDRGGKLPPLTPGSLSRTSQDALRDSRLQAIIRRSMENP